MAAPTVSVTVKLSSQDGTAHSGVFVSAKLDKNDIYQGFVISGEVTAITNALGVAVLNLFPNHPATGLGTTGSVYVFKASPPGGKTLRVAAQIPNTNCSLEAVANIELSPGLNDAQAALASAQGFNAQSSASAGAATEAATAANASKAASAASASSASSSASSANLSANSASASATAAQTSGSAVALTGNLAAGTEAGGSSLVGYSDPVAPAFLKTLSDVINGERVSLFRFINKSLHVGLRDGTDLNTDLTASIQAAADAADSGSFDLYVPPVKTHLRTTAPINVIRPMHISGAGVTPYASSVTGTRGRGSWFYFDHTGVGFNVAAAGNALMGSVYFDGIGTVRNQPAPVSGWTPTANDFDIKINNTDVHIGRLMLYNATKGVQLNNGAAGRLTIDRLFGQCMQVGLDVDAAFDVVSANGVHFWPFWMDNSFVHAYTIENLDAVYLRRCDNPKFTNLFTIFSRAGIRFGQNALGRTLKVKVANADFDRGKFGIWVDSTVTSGVLGFFQNVTHQGETGAAGSEFLKIDGTNSTLDFGAVRTDYCGLSAVNISGAANTTRFGVATLLNYNQDVAGVAAVRVAGSSTVDFMQNPVIGGGGAGPRYSGAGTILTEDWRSYAPVITSQTGAITTVGSVTGSYQAHNNRCTFKLLIVITTNGTAAGDLRFTLPPGFLPADDSQGTGREVNISGLGVHVSISSGNNVASITTAANAYPGGTGAALIVTGSYRF